MGKKGIRCSISQLFQFKIERDFEPIVNYFKILSKFNFKSFSDRDRERFQEGILYGPVDEAHRPYNG
jgi:hypothetical protein